MRSFNLLKSDKKLKNIKYTSFLFFLYIFLNILLSASPGDVIITEIFYKKSAGNLPEYVELYNRTNEDINLHGWIMKFGSNILNIEEVFDPGSVDVFNIKAQKHVALITDGQFKSESGVTFCSANNYHYIYNTCIGSSYHFFWRQGGFSGLDDTSDSIIIIDKNGVEIDAVIYSQNNNFPIQSDVSGKSIEFIINPDISMADSLNDIGENWKLSEQLSDSLWNGTSKDYGSPLAENHINPKIKVANSLNTPSNLSIASECFEENSQTICKPGSDGYPGGYVSIQVEASAFDNIETVLNLDFLDATIEYGDADIDSYSSTSNVGETLIWTPENLLSKDIDSVAQYYSVSLTIRDSIKKRYGKSHKTFSIQQENNSAPIIRSINNQQLDQVVEVYENTQTNINMVVTDLELCPLLTEPCDFSDLDTTINSYWHDNSAPFLWSGDSINLLNNTSLLSNIFNSGSIDSLNGISANNNPDTVHFTFKVSDPFGYSSQSAINVVVKNLNQKPKLETITLDQTIVEDDSLIIELQGSDVDGDSLFFTAIWDENVDTIIVNSNILTVVPKLNFNGNMFVTIYVHDDEDNLASNDENSFSISVLPKNDMPSEFSIYPNLFSYNSGLIDSTSIYLDSTNSIYFRLPQNSSSYSDSISQLLSFKWEKKDSLDVDMLFELNADRSSLFYRLEAILNDSMYIILKDSLDHDSFIEESIYANINVKDSFSYYLDSYQNSFNNEKLLLDIFGYSSYSWRVIAQNYSLDLYENDPFRISSNSQSSKFKIDLIQPEISHFDIIINNMIPNYYDIIWYTTEPLLSDYTFLDIYEKNNKFDLSGELTPRRVSSVGYHITRPFPTDLVSANIIFDLELRDMAMNSGLYQDTLTYLLLSPDTALTVESNSEKISLQFPQNSVLKPINIIIVESDEYALNRDRTVFIDPIAPTLSIYPLALMLEKKVLVTFDLNKQIIDNFDPDELVVCKIYNSKMYPIKTEYSDGKLFSEIESFGSYSIFIDENNNVEIPLQFEIGSNYPNPFNTSTSIPIKLPYESFIEVSIYNLLGEKVSVLLSGNQLAGEYIIDWNGVDNFNQPISSGIYFVVSKYDDKIFSQKIMLLK